MNVSSIALLAGKLALSEAKKWAKAHGSRMGEWRGNLVAEDLGKNCWHVEQDDADPRRLWIPAVGLEYSWGGGGWKSDGPTIPWVACKILGCTRETFKEDGFLHDFMYRTAYVWCRIPGHKWVRVPVTKKQADLILRIGVNADGATNGQETAIYAGVRTSFGRAAWKEWRDRSKGEMSP